MPESPELKALIKKRGSLKSRLTVYKKYVDSVQNRRANTENALNDAELIGLQQRNSRIEPIIKEFEEIQTQIECTADDTEEQCKERESFEEMYDTLLPIAKNLLLGYTPNKIEEHAIANTSVSSVIPNPSSGHAHLSGIKLPTIQMPKFDGSYENWLEFRDTFKSLIHDNDSISDVQKFHYLRASLQNTAAQVINSLEFSAANYAVAWDVLSSRFNNTRVLVHNHVKALFNLQCITTECSLKIRKLIDSVSKHRRSLSLLNQPTSEWDTLIIYIISTKLDSVTVREWEQYKAENDLPTLENLKQFLKARADLLETLEANQTEKKGGKPRAYVNPRTFIGTSTSTSQKCAFCKADDHLIYNCGDFLKLTVNDRVEQIRKSNLCINCLKGNHFSKACRSGGCRKCSAKHNTLLHFEAQPKQNSNQGSNVTLSSFNLSNRQVLLSTAYVQIIDANYKAHSVRALLDCGSQSSFITLQLCKRLNLASEKVDIAVSGLNNAISNIERKRQLTFQSQHNAYSARIACYVLPEITGNLPSYNVDTTEFKIPKNIKLADPTFSNPEKIEMLIGSDCFWNLICIGQINLGRNQRVLQKTRLGWIVAGPVGQTLNSSQVHCNFGKTLEVEDQLKRFWEIEECSLSAPFSCEENACESHYKQNTKRTNQGRFIVSIPWKESVDKLGESRERARRRFYSLERKLQANPDLREQYINFMEEYVSLGHMSEVDNDESSRPTYYMPHHGVIRSESLTTKLRVVFDGSAQTTTGWSINNLQMVGPVIQQDLFSIIIRFRKHSYVVSADIAKMYRQVLVEPGQRQLQRILWRSDPSQPLKSYNLNTITYGTAAASFLAIRCLHELAHGCQETSPEIAKVIREDFYVDDLLSGSESVGALSKICEKVSEVLRGGCFELRKWRSNNTEVFMGANQSQGASDIVDFGVNENTKTLGLTWACQTDVLMYNINITLDSKQITKRSILSTIAQIFDPLGLLSPCTITAKIIFKNSWLGKLTWDECIPASLHFKWVKFREKLSYLNKLSIPRLALIRKRISVKLHGFSDAFENACAACIYPRSVNVQGQISVQLLCAKTRVAPLKTITVPRLELSGAVILAILASKVAHAPEQKFDGCTTIWSWACMYSDNGTNFVGANPELQNFDTFLRAENLNLVESIANEGISWHFIPAHSPHFGGLWEAGVKNVKHHLKRVVGNASLTYEEFYTLLVQIEAILNSRPLSPLSSEPDDPHPLTPAHFLVGGALTSLPDPDVTHIPEPRLSRFQRLQQLHQHFWRRWSKEYISELQQRTKWRQNQDQLKEGAMVVIKDDNLQLGRIVQVRPGSDSVVRVVSIKTAKGIIRRAVQKVCPLPHDSEH